ncbi:MAG: hypothetical protein IT371_14615 [Deltaproteobacteria bacterium]|nr:hypothetical protein [Deltaproteobacteria bacterium]
MDETDSEVLPPKGGGSSYGQGGVAPRMPCLPRAAAFAETPLLPSEAGVVGGACRLAQVRYDTDADGTVNSEVTYEREAGLLSVVSRGPGGVELSRTRYLLDATGRALEMQTVAQGRVGQVYARRYDSAGHLLSQRLTYPGGFTHVDQVWHEGRLVERRETGSHGQVTRYTWKYAPAGRLVHGAATTSGPRAALHEVHWGYDDGGRPSSMLRSVDGRALARVDWRWLPTGTMAERTVTLETPGPSSPLVELDDVVRRASSAPAEASSCRPLRTSLFEGYAEAAYRVGWLAPSKGQASSGYPPAVDEDALYSRGLGAMYYACAYCSYGSYRYFGGLEGTSYGHFGPGGPWLAAVRPGGRVRVAISYDAAGRMVREEATTQPATTAEGGESPRHIVRRRALQAGRVISDRIEVPGEDGSTYVRELSFVYDRSGQLNARELRHDDQVLERQTWRYDETGQASEHTLAGQIGAAGRFVQRPGVVPPDLADPVPEGSLYRRHDAGTGLLVREWSARASAPGEELGLQTFRYDGQGRATETISGAGSEARRQIVAYDEAGREVLRGVRRDLAQGWDSLLLTTYNGTGLPTRIESTYRGYGGTSRTSVETRSYACGD